MTPERINIAIAGLIGYRQAEVYEWDTENPSIRLPKQFHVDKCGVAHGLPDYRGSLDACVEFEAGLDREQATAYHDSLIEMTGRDGPSLTECRLGTPYARRWTWHASAPQRCEAFLRLHGKWEGAA